MFKVESRILDFFKLVLRITLELAPDARHKGLGITKILSEEGLKLFSGYGDILALVKSVTTLVLHPSEANTPVKERGSKRDAISPSGLSSVKMIFTLLAKVITVHV